MMILASDSRGKHFGQRTCRRRRNSRTAFGDERSRSSRLSTKRPPGPCGAFICRVCGKPELADDLLQETYLRFLRAADLKAEAALRKAYLYKIATNLMTDHWRTSAREQPICGDQSFRRGVSRGGSIRSKGRRRGCDCQPRPVAGISATQTDGTLTALAGLRRRIGASRDCCGAGAETEKHSRTALSRPSEVRPAF